MTLLRILSPRPRGILLTWRVHSPTRRLAAAWSRPATTDLVEARIVQAIRRHAELRRAA